MGGALFCPYLIFIAITIQFVLHSVNTILYCCFLAVSKVHTFFNQVELKSKKGSGSTSSSQIKVKALKCSIKVQTVPLKSISTEPHVILLELQSESESLYCHANKEFF